MDERAGYLSDVLLSGATVDQLTAFVDIYDVAILEGSPFARVSSTIGIRGLGA
jgi:hypothetical protein